MNRCETGWLDDYEAFTASGVILLMEHRGIVKSPQHWSGFSPKCPARVSDFLSLAMIQPTERQAVTVLSSSSRRTHPSPRRESSHSTSTNSLLRAATGTPASTETGCSHATLIAFTAVHLFCGQPCDPLRCSFTCHRDSPVISSPNCRTESKP